MAQVQGVQRRPARSRPTHAHGARAPLRDRGRAHATGCAFDYYDRIDELRALRREALLAEMRHVEAQAECWLEEHPDEAARIAAEHRRTQATPEMLLGTAVVNGEQPRIRLHARDLPDRPQPSRLRAVHVVRRERALGAELAAADLRPAPALAPLCPSLRSEPLAL